MKHLDIDLFRTNLYYKIGGTLKKALREFEKGTGASFDYSDLDKFDGMCEFNSNVVFLWCRNKSPSLVAHECVHAAHLILDKIGIPIGIENEEVVAHLVEFLMKRIMNGWSEVICPAP